MASALNNSLQNPQYQGMEATRGLLDGIRDVYQEEKEEGWSHCAFIATKVAIIALYILLLPLAVVVDGLNNLLVNPAIYLYNRFAGSRPDNAQREA